MPFDAILRYADVTFAAAISLMPPCSLRRRQRHYAAMLTYATMLLSAISCCCHYDDAAMLSLSPYLMLMILLITLLMPLDIVGAPLFLLFRYAAIFAAALMSISSPLSMLPRDFRHFADLRSISRDYASRFISLR